MKAIGLDIGTTTLCGTVLDLTTGKLLHIVTQPNNAVMQGEASWQSLQNPDTIVSGCTNLLAGLLKDHPDIAAMGVTGQMHGILYVDTYGNALSPLATWQDARGNLPMTDNKTYAEVLGQNTGTVSATGFGLVTLLHDSATGLVPTKAKTICTIGDYIAMKLCGNTAPRLHASNAASLGGFDLGANNFMKNLPSAIDRALLPLVLEGEQIVGHFHGIPVCCAVGDNQASAFGSLGSGVTALVNVGTGSQVSTISLQPIQYDNGLECRPYVDGKYLSVGAALCGGYAYHMLRDFFAQSAVLMGANIPNNLYQIMDQWAEASRTAQPLTVDTRFHGTRQNPTIRGSIQDIGAGNFTPGGLCLGVLEGICEELFQLYKGISPAPLPDRILAASGNGIRNSPLTQEIFSKRFGMALAIPRFLEEASFGTALIASVAAGLLNYQQATGLVAYD